ncbi:hypothetical protein EST62_03575 [Chlorobaculum sp. 24CR]|uniref:hypothetical protein n=1 Tax=Chlorobaculum sp. 24CR TaxID=2508878 RepID=UPI00100BE407|nr:hypothetical protein [Chlorobaculum sp. 24CR]RXK88307.1 hypothetical protein EST62_03575 [Chlorobaculum sp. 24CR]
MVLRRQLSRAALALFVAAAFGATPALAGYTADSNTIHNGPCTKQVGNRQVTLAITPRPVRHMRELTFRVTMAPAEGVPATLVLDLSMPGMVMGKNQVTLKRQADGAWKGRGIIVKCMSGGTLWKAMILSQQLGNPSFTFNVRD